MKKIFIVSIILALALSMTPCSFADEYDKEDAGNPVRFLSYVFYPIGFAIDYLILRPAHYLVHQGKMQKVFNHEADKEYFAKDPEK